MLKVNRKLCMVLVLLFAVFSASALTYTPSVELSTGPSFFIPTVDSLKNDAVGKLPGMRSSFYTEADATAVEFDFNSWRAGAGFTFLFNSRSAAYRTSIMRGYIAYGPYIDFGRVFTDKFELNLKLKMLFCNFTRATNSTFARFDAVVTPYLTVVDKRVFNLKLGAPVTVGIKKDGLILGVGVCAKAEFEVDFHGKKN